MISILEFLLKHKTTKKEAEAAKKALDKMTGENTRGKNTVMSNAQWAEAEKKMKAWHDGTRKQNLSNCSDAKLKMNYQVCLRLGFDVEAQKIAKEAESRGISVL